MANCEKPTQLGLVMRKNPAAASDRLFSCASARAFLSSAPNHARITSSHKRFIVNTRDHHWNRNAETSKFAIQQNRKLVIQNSVLRKCLRMRGIFINALRNMVREYYWCIYQPIMYWNKLVRALSHGREDPGVIRLSHSARRIDCLLLQRWLQRGMRGQAISSPKQDIIIT